MRCWPTSPTRSDPPPRAEDSPSPDECGGGRSGVGGGRGDLRCAGDATREITIPRDPIGTGERAPDFVLPRGHEGGRSRFYAFVGGRPALLVFAGGPHAAGEELLSRLRATMPAAADSFLVSLEPPAGADADTFHDPDGRVHDAYGVARDGVPTVVVLDRNVRVLAVERPPDPPSLDVVLAHLSDPDEDPSGEEAHAPVLRVPRALDPALCDRVIAAWRAADPAETGVETMADGRHEETLDRLRKRRRDHVVTQPELLRELTAHIGRRVMPELQKAFAYRASRFEGFKIGCYTADDEGFFQAHRDNLSPATAHRRFALSLNLNDDYDGGELRFPEYGRRLYRPAAGEALVFSGSHLHEVRPVVRGRRFVLLSFLFDGGRER